MMKVTIFGPNLRVQTKGTFHVHAAGCADCRHYGPGTKYGGDDRGWTVEVGSALQVCGEVYADHLGDYGLEYGTPEADAMLDDWLADFHFAPCTKGLA